METNKMQWFVNAYKAGKLKYEIHNSGESFGTIVKPTGAGKSALVYEDIIHRIDNYTGDRKIIFNISCPILKLSQQFIKDLFDALAVIYGTSKRIDFYINSSDNGNNYNEALAQLESDAFKFTDIDRFIAQTRTNFAIMASCHKSMPKLISEVSRLSKSGVDVISYIDEAHLVDLIKNGDDEMSWMDINKLCKDSKCVYAFSATPNPDVTEMLNTWNGHNGSRSHYIIHQRPIEAINENIILAPYIHFSSLPNDLSSNDIRITDTICRSVMKRAKEENPNINHKILVTLKSSKELDSLRRELEKSGYKVFSTCSAFGYGKQGDEAEVDYEDVTGFIKDIDEYDGDLFVLHIRMLIAGIDIKSLTDCIIFDANNGNQAHYRHTIQTIGRCLRPLAGERGKAKADRKKKIGGVFFITPFDGDEVQSNMSQFLIRYYGLDNIQFETARKIESACIDCMELFDDLNSVHLGTGWDNPQIQALLVNIEKYIQTQLKPYWEFEQSIGKKHKVEVEARRILRRHDAFNKEFNSDDLLDNRELLEAVEGMIKKYVVQPLF